MTEYWVSQGNKWCEFCKIFIQNNPTSIRNHELGTRHRDNVNKKLSDMREKSVAKDKELKEAERMLQQIEAKATRSYQKDIETLQKAAKANSAPDDGQGEWTFDSASGYHYNQTNGLHYDSNSGFYYADSIGKWVTREEAYAAVNASSNTKTQELLVKKPTTTSGAGPSTMKQNDSKSQSGLAPGHVVSASLNPTIPVKGAPSSIDLGKRKRQDQKPKNVSEEERAALKAREAARRRVEEREKSLLGLYNRPF
ncbi:PREDICTED: zinc finger protein ZOP1 [Tarenaya hassleriana]|uniref:zinc finger protein ZOP1 n=1 Tax=Tarenaya hassleriana TaxID=28532 RepID=UPI00053C14C5|nr:PREDICTED: zinc finger protein ZOP1 [Tarenaya hassleriana]XP_010523214.1 PREDICTED: zinc finger protein ZOP1 [Tarenaya hassleriana]XP_010523215.1 PREDICTED: zinc finger protein ZOP1 [Tarenaya hassleriana]XP_010523216.1 PREDICTED: zinc finger protein ZOP1 [Tarenaya hassleriana]